MTDNCNLRCSYCYERSNTDNIIKSNEIELTDTIDVIKILKKYSSKEGCSLIFFGGEPLLKFELIKSIVKEIKNYPDLYNKISYSITTNATRITKEIASFFKENNFAIVISIDGGEKITNINRKHANGKGAFETIKSRILLLDGMFLNARATITNTNLNLTQNHIALYDLGFSSIAQSESYELIDNQNISILKQEICNYYDYFYELLESKKYKKCQSFKDILKYLISVHIGVRQHNHCGAGKSLIAVTPNFQIIPCQRFIDEKFKEVSLDSDLNCLNKFDNKNDEFYNCKDCIAYSICAGGCYHTNMVLQNTTKETSPFCNLMNCKVENAIRLYLKLTDDDKRIIFGEMY